MTCRSDSYPTLELLLFVMPHAITLDEDQITAIVRRRCESMMTAHDIKELALEGLAHIRYASDDELAGDKMELANLHALAWAALADERVIKAVDALEKIDNFRESQAA